MKKPSKPVLEHEDFALEVWQTKETKGYKVRFKRGSESQMRNLHVTPQIVSVNDIAVFRNEEWIVIDPLKEEKLKLEFLENQRIRQNKQKLREEERQVHLDLV